MFRDHVADVQTSRSIDYTSGLSALRTATANPLQTALSFVADVRPKLVSQPNRSSTETHIVYNSFKYELHCFDLLWIFCTVRQTLLVIKKTCRYVTVTLANFTTRFL